MNQWRGRSAYGARPHSVSVGESSGQFAEVLALLMIWRLAWKESARDGSNRVHHYRSRIRNNKTDAEVRKYRSNQDRRTTRRASNVLLLRKAQSVSPTGTLLCRKKRRMETVVPFGIPTPFPRGGANAGDPGQGYGLGSQIRHHTLTFFF